MIVVICECYHSGRYGRLLNHSRLHPNCKAKVYLLGSTPKLILIAKNDIKNGDELCFDYGERNKKSILANPWLSL